MSAETKLRPPWPDELPRAQHFLPAPFLFDPKPFVLLAVRGRVERIVAAAGLTVRAFEDIPSTWLYLRVDSEDPIGPELLERSVAEAWKRGAASVHFGQTIDEESSMAAALTAANFTRSAVHEVYEVDAAFVGERLDRSYQRIRQRKVIPEDVELITLQPTLIPRIRKFLMQNMPGSAASLAHETAGYKAEHSIALLQAGEVKGVVLCRRVGPVAYVGLRVVSEDLRGGIGWANLMLLHASIMSGLQTGLKSTRFEFNPEHHYDTKQFAEFNGARLVGRRLLLKIDNPVKND